MIRGAKAMQKVNTFYIQMLTRDSMGQQRMLLLLFLVWVHTEILL